LTTAIDILPTAFSTAQLTAGERQLLEQFLEHFRYDHLADDHFLFACYAAFPVIVTPELLYKLWMNFNTYQDAQGNKQHIRRVVLADLLLSDLFREVGAERFQMPLRLRTTFLSYLQQPKGFQKVASPKELGFFILDYFEQNFVVRTPADQAFREAQVWNAWTYIDPEVAVRMISNVFRQSTQAQKSQRLRLSLLMEEMAHKIHTSTPPSFQQTAAVLDVFSKGWQAYLRGNPETALQLFKQAAPADAVMMQLPVPEEIAEQLRFETQSTEYHYFGVGMDTYSRQMSLVGLSFHVSYFKGYLESVGLENLQTKAFFDTAATRQAVLEYLENTLPDLRANGLFIFHFSGKGDNKRTPQRIYLSDADTSKSEQTTISTEEFRAVVEKNANCHILLLLEADSGADDWLNPQNDKHIVIAACAKHQIAAAGEFEEDRAFQGFFSKTFFEALRVTGGDLTYRSLMRRIRLQLIELGQQQTPQFFGTENALNRLFLQTQPTPDVYLQELLADNGLFNEEEEIETTVRRFLENYKLEREDAIFALESRRLVREETSLRLVVIGSDWLVSDEENYTSQFARILEERLPKFNLGNSETISAENQDLLEELRSVRNFIAEAEMRKALELLLKLASQVSSEVENSVLMQVGRFERLEDSILKGIISNEQSNIERNRIAAATLSITNDLQEQLKGNSQTDNITYFQEPAVQTNIGSGSMTISQNTETDISHWQTLEHAHAILFLLDEKLKQHPLYGQIEQAVLQQNRIMGVPVFLILLDEPIWSITKEHRFFVLPSHEEPIYWTNLEHKTGNKIRTTLEELEHRLEQMTAFLRMPTKLPKNWQPIQNLLKSSKLEPLSIFHLTSAGRHNELDQFWNFYEEYELAEVQLHIILGAPEAMPTLLAERLTYEFIEAELDNDFDALFYEKDHSGRVIFREFPVKRNLVSSRRAFRRLLHELQIPKNETLTQLQQEYKKLQNRLTDLEGGLERAYTSEERFDYRTQISYTEKQLDDLRAQIDGFIESGKSDIPRKVMLHFRLLEHALEQDFLSEYLHSLRDMLLEHQLLNYLIFVSLFSDAEQAMDVSKRLLSTEMPVNLMQLNPNISQQEITDWLVDIGIPEQAAEQILSAFVSGCSAKVKHIFNDDRSLPMSDFNLLQLAIFNESHR